MITPPIPQNIQRAAEQIKNGGLIAYPTETVYGLGADPYRREAMQKIFIAKGRAETKGIILLIRGADDLATLVRAISPSAQTLIRAFWPGAAHPHFQSQSKPPTFPAGRPRHHCPAPFQFSHRRATADRIGRPSHQHQRESLGHPACALRS